MQYPENARLVFRPIGGIGDGAGQIGGNCYFLQDAKTLASFGIDAGEIVKREQYKQKLAEDYLPDASLLGDADSRDVVFWLASHGHRDHLNPKAIAKLTKRLKSAIPLLASETALQYLELEIRQVARDMAESSVMSDRMKKEVLEKELRNIDISDSNRKRGLRAEIRRLEGETKREFGKVYGETIRRLTPENLLKSKKHGTSEYAYMLPEDKRIISPNGHFAGNLKIIPFLANHSIPGTYCFLVEGNGARVVFLSDCKLNGYKPEDRERFEQFLRNISARGPVDLVIIDALNATIPGIIPMESIVIDNVEKIIVDCLARGKKIIISGFASNLERMRRFAKVVERHTEMPPAYLGGAMFSGARFNGLEPKKPKDFSDWLVVIATGSQSEDGFSGSGHSMTSALIKMIRGESDITLDENCAVILSSRAIPGTKNNPGSEKDIQDMVCRMDARGVEVYLNKGEKENLMIPDACRNVFEREIHVSGHEASGGKKIILSILGESSSPDRPMKVVPYHAEMKEMMAMEALLPEHAELVIMKNGETLII
ncbi:MAG: hypothetical protein U9P90_00150 [Patescibacteria group bacterium]|nr:hypothetical protein [Patescibacteria group bacterium]